MKLKIFSIYDIKSATYGTLNFYRTTDEAIRALGDHCNNPDSNYYKFAEDFSLYELGTFDDTSGLAELHPPLIVIHCMHLSRQHNEYYAARNMERAVS